MQANPMRNTQGKALRGIRKRELCLNNFSIFIVTLILICRFADILPTIPIFEKISGLELKSYSSHL